MEQQRFFIRGKKVDADDAALQEALDRIYETPEWPCCMCIRGGVETYVAKHRQYVVKRMPGTGNLHHLYIRFRHYILRVQDVCELIPKIWGNKCRKVSVGN